MEPIAIAAKVFCVGDVCDGFPCLLGALGGQKMRSALDLVPGAPTIRHVTAPGTVTPSVGY